VSSSFIYGSSLMFFFEDVHRGSWCNMGEHSREMKESGPSIRASVKLDCPRLIAVFLVHHEVQ
jgi:hypothetical protein